MRSFGNSAIAALAGAILAVAALSAEVPPAESLLKEARAREADLRHEIDTRLPTSDIAALIRRTRILVGTYQDIARLFQKSDQADDALWQGGMLAADTFWTFGEGPDRATALRLFDALSTQHPASPFVRQVVSQTGRLKRAPSSTTTPEVAPAAGTKATAPAPSGSNGRMTAVASTVLKSIRREVLPSAVRVVLDLEGEAVFQDERIDAPPRVFIDIQNTRAAEPLKDARLTFPDEIVRQIRVGRQIGSRIRVVLDLDSASRHSVYALYNPYRIVIDLERPLVPGLVEREPVVAARGPTDVARNTDAAPAVGGATSAPVSPPRVGSSITPSPVDAPTARTTAEDAAPIAPRTNGNGSFSMARQLGLGVAKIVIDPGHGGYDPGAQLGGLSEADVVLDVGLRLEKLLLAQRGFEVVLTRRTNVFVPLEDRPAMANRDDADLFLSIHVNASADQRARGVETYFLNFATNPQAEALAARENAGSLKTMRSLPDLVKAITLNNKIDESHDLATAVQASLVERLKKANRTVRNLGVKQAPFVVLIGATMPSILAEISFLTNRQEAALLKTAAYRQQIAEALLQGVVRYQRSLKTNQRAPRRGEVALGSS